MLLNIPDRFAILGLLPKEGGVADLRVLRETQNKVAPSEEEFKKYNIKQDENRITWNNEAAEDIDIELGDRAKEIIKDLLIDLDKKKKMTWNQMNIYEIFVEGKAKEK